jgi:hypothetical protein
MSGILDKLRAYPIVTNVDPHDIITRGKVWYEGIKAELEPEHKGRFVAIDPDTGDYFLGDRGIEATLQAKEKYPDKVFYLARIGYPTAYNL